ncbi:DUF262 domain-containing protein [Halocatena salina]|uniref:DUF262 domain-containing protein n=1 Tax=Halocatena salina TaxID=2934340 RepID=A0A8U0A043_9EURY|nr:DUF262 domain-containing protein [Halocatena salina]UPM42119.1 DUF262 domain-containing protein [Halocatena salina]
MTYQSMQIANIIPDINNQFFLPGIQREFVWNTDQIIQLFDSVIRGYPIGSFLFWNVRGKVAKERIKYEFIKHYITEGVYPAEFDDRDFRNPKVRDEYSEGLPNKLTLVLDGQQRLSSFYIGLKGSLTDRGYNQRKKKPDSWDRKKLYMNLLFDNATVMDNEFGLKYMLEFKEPKPSHSETEYWFFVGDILDIESRDDAYERTDEIMNELEMVGIDGIERSNIQRNLNDLWQTFHERNIINYYELGAKHNDDILDIFIRANDGGTQLSKEEMMLSVATAEWSKSNNPTDARKKVTTLVDKLNNYYPNSNFNFATNFVLRSLLVATGLRSKYDMQAFSSDNLQEMKSTFEEDEFEGSFFKALDLIKSYGLDGRSVSSTVAIIPIVYFFYLNKNYNLSWESKQGRKTRAKIFYWLSTTLLKGSYTQSGHQVMTVTQDAIEAAPRGVFPLESLHHEVLAMGKPITFLEEEAREMLQSLKYRDRHAKIFLSLLYFPDPASEHETFEIDHIFPRSELTERNLIEDYDMNVTQAKRYDSLRDSILNLQLLTPEENAEKADRPYNEWLQSRHESQLNRHYIPQDDNQDLYTVAQFEDFLNLRKELIVSEIIEMSNKIEELFDSS